MEQNEANPPQRYIWPRFVLAGVVLGIVLAVIWMAVLVRRVREQRDFTPWPTTSPTQSVTIPPAPTNPAPAQPASPTNVSPPKART